MDSPHLYCYRTIIIPNFIAIHTKIKDEAQNFLKQKKIQWQYCSDNLLPTGSSKWY